MCSHKGAVTPVAVALVEAEMASAVEEMEQVEVATARAAAARAGEAVVTVPAAGVMA